MKADDLLDYALGQLDGPPLALLEAELGRDPALKARADRLGASLAALLDDGAGPEPPPGLASRTVAFMAEQAAQPPRRMILDFAPKRVPFRWSDLATAAGIFLAGGLTLLPAIRSGREQMNQATCSYNLRELGTNLANYAIRHQHYPKVCDVGTNEPVGKYAADLRGEALLPDAKTLHCPCKGDCPAPEVASDPKAMDFAYNVGYRDAGSGHLVPISPRIGAVVPLLADQPNHDGRGSILAGNSPNHAGRGQNVLFSDLHLRWLSNRRVSPVDRDLFLNDRDQAQPGVSVQDSALMPASFRLGVPY